MLIFLLHKILAIFASCRYIIRANNQSVEIVVITQFNAIFILSRKYKKSTCGEFHGIFFC